MHGLEPIFLYYSRRARQEQLAAIRATCPAAAAAHRTLSTLHGEQAVRAADGA